MHGIRRREFVTLLGSAAASWPLAARAQQPARMRRIGILHNSALDSDDAQYRVGAFLQELALSGWAIGRNMRIDARWAGGNNAEMRRYAAELVALAPDVILASSSQAVAALQSAIRTVPIVFVTVIDPVGAGFVDSLARPGGNTTGFELYEYSIGGKWLELLKQIAPSVVRVAVLRDPSIAAGSGLLGAIQSVAPSVGVALNPVNLRDAGEIERTITAFARESDGGLIVAGATLASIHRELIITLAARHRLPAVYSNRFFVAGGGLISYGPDRVDVYRPAPPATSIASSGARSRPTCRCRLRASTRRCSTSRPPRPSASTSRKRCWPPPTR
jgi:putative tryptophan/tyrosine transport system substrate-binding protein